MEQYCLLYIIIISLLFLLKCAILFTTLKYIHEFKDEIKNKNPSLYNISFGLLVAYIFTFYIYSFICIYNSLK